MSNELNDINKWMKLGESILNEEDGDLRSTLVDELKKDLARYSKEYSSEDKEDLEAELRYEVENGEAYSWIREKYGLTGEWTDENSEYDEAFEIAWNQVF